MCGICGIVNLRVAPPPSTELLTRMMGRPYHRGPGSSGYYRNEQVALGHTRLSIIDLESGSQPLSNEDESVWITFNGEIFNYVELSTELSSLGHVFRTKSDTEVIVHAYEQWRLSCFERFNGQWALALWDRRSKTIALSRDRLGIRPLYYTLCGNRLLFASEIKAIFVDNSVHRELDPAGLAEIFTFWCPVAPRTSFRDIQELEPGHYAILKGGHLKSRAYWSISFPVAGAEPSQNEDDNAKQLRHHLIDAARLRFLRSDVPVGAYLSGGIDSSITFAIVNQYTEAPLHTFSIRFQDTEFDKGTHQKAMVKKLGTLHQDVVVRNEDLSAVFPEVVWHAERPILRTAPAPLFLLSKLVRESDYKVVVTGEGADEVLAGYDIFREAKARSFLARDPNSDKRTQILLCLYPWMARSPGKIPAFARAFFAQNLDPEDPGFSHRPRWDTTAALKLLLDPDLRMEIEQYKVDDDLLSLVPKNYTQWDQVTRSQWLEMVTLLTGYILSAKGDRMLMAHSVEGRFPFLDYRLVDFANQLPARHKLMGMDEKHILKVSCGDLVPASIVERPKQPYRAPDAASFFSTNQLDWVRDLTSPHHLKQTGIFDAAAVEKMFAKCSRAGATKMSNTDNMRVVAILSTLLIQKLYIDEDGRRFSRNTPPQPMKKVDMVGKVE